MASNLRNIQQKSNKINIKQSKELVGYVSETAPIVAITNRLTNKYLS